jgi:hypothetical protein
VTETDLTSESRNPHVSETLHKAKKLVPHDESARPIFISIHVRDGFDNSRRHKESGGSVEATRLPTQSRGGFCGISLIIVEI